MRTAGVKKSSGLPIVVHSKTPYPLLYFSCFAALDTNVERPFYDRTVSTESYIVYSFLPKWPYDSLMTGLKVCVDQ